MNQSIKLHRQEVSPLEFARRRVFVDPDPLEGQCWFRKDSNVKRAVIASGCNIVLPAEDSFADEIRNKSSPKKTIEIPKMKLLEEELSKVKETKHPSPPSLIARLMGLDASPPQKKEMDSCCQITSSPSLLGNYADGENCSQWRNTEKQEFKDVFEVTEAPKSRKHTNLSDTIHTNHTMTTRKRRVYEVDASITRKKFADVKGQSSIELLHNSKEFDDAFEITDFGKDLSLEHIQDSKSLFAKHLQDLKHAPSSSQSSRIIVLKPYKCCTEHWSNKVQGRTCKTEKGNDRFYHERWEITGSYMPYATRLKKGHGEEDRSSLPHNPPPSRGRSETVVLPFPIVVLKPIHKKAEKVAEDSFLKHDHLWFDSKQDRKIAASRTRVFQHEERNVENLFRYHNGLNHKVDGSERIYRNITRKMRHNRNRLTEWKFTSQTGMYAATRDSLVTPDIAELVHSDSVPQSPDPHGDRVSSFTSSTIKSKSYVAMEPSHYSKRRNVTQQFHDSGYISRCSSTPGEISEPFEEETTKYTLEFSKNISAKNLSRDEVLLNKICHLGISSKDACRYGSSRLSPSSKSISDSGVPKLTDIKAVGGKTAILGNVPDVESSDSLDAKFCMLIPPVKRSEHQNHTYQIDDSIEDKDMLPECEIHVDSEGLGKGVSKLNTTPTNHSMTERYCLNDSIYVPIPRDKAWKLITHDQELGSTFQVPSSHIHNHKVIQEKLSSHPQVKFILSESNIAESQLKSYLEQPSPIFVSETLSRNETSSSDFGCFERLSAELEELRSQLQRLKMESAGTCSEESEVLMLSDEDCAGSNTILLPPGNSHEGFRDDDDRDFTYLLDILVESGIQNIDDSKLLNACCLLECPLDQSIFRKLEKKYDGIAAAWSRLERKLLFDLISCCLADLVSSSMSVCPQLISSTRLPACDCSSLIEGLWQVVVEQKKGLQECSDNKVLEPGLFGWRYDMDLVVIEMEKILNADLLEELVCELQAAWVLICSSYADHSPT